MYRKLAVQQVGTYTVPYCEDFELFWQLSRRFIITPLAEVLLDYRLSSQSLHSVTKKEEYNQAQLAQIARNIQYYAGAGFSISETHLQCLQHNFQPLLAEKNLQSILLCIKELDYIFKCILNKANPNREVEAIKKAHFYKRNYIIMHFIKKLPRYKGALLILYLMHFKEIAKEISKYTWKAKVKNE